MNSQKRFPGLPDIPSMDFSYNPNQIQTQGIAYEGSVLHEMASDIKSPSEEQLLAIEKIANSASEMADNAIRQADSAEKSIEPLNEIANSAHKIAYRADVKSWIAIAVSVLALVLEGIIHYQELIGFFNLLFNH